VNNQDLNPDLAIAARDLGKRYEIYERPSDRLRQTLWRGRRRFYREFWALRGVTFDASRGAAVGLVGRNGSGKSTLLQILAGVLTPTTGEAILRGRTAAVLELGCAFSPEHTGRENALLSAQLLGMTRHEALEKLTKIERFAEIGDFFDRPLRVYSTGMYSRLAFAVYAHVDADVLLLDEIVSVGDSAFQRKCFRRIGDLRERGATIILATHDTAVVRRVCDTAVMLEAGCLHAVGRPAEVIDEYLAVLLSSSASAQRSTARLDFMPDPDEGTQSHQAVATSFKEEFMRQVPPKMRFSDAGKHDLVGGGPAIVSAAMVLDRGGQPVASVKVGEICTLRALLRVRLPVDHLACGFLIRDRFGQDIFGQTVTTEGLGIEGPLVAGDLIAIDVRFRCDLRQDTYFVTYGLGDLATEVQYFYASDLLEFRVEPQGTPIFGLTDLPYESEGWLISVDQVVPEERVAIESVRR